MPYTAYTFLAAGYGEDVMFGGPTGPGWLLDTGHAKDSSSVRVILHDDENRERQGLGEREALKALAPQLLEAPVLAMLTDASSTEALRAFVDQAAATGHELAILGYGAAGWCAFCSAQINNASVAALEPVLTRVEEIFAGKRPLDTR